MHSLTAALTSRDRERIERSGDCEVSKSVLNLKAWSSVAEISATVRRIPVRQIGHLPWQDEVDGSPDVTPRLLAGARGTGQRDLPVGEKTKMPDLHEAARQDLEQESPNEFGGTDGHELLLVIVGGVSPAQRDLAVAEVDRAPVGNRHPMGIPGKVADRMIRTQRRLGINDPFETAKLSNKAFELGRVR